MNICVDLSDGEVIFWIDSIDLHELIISQTETLFEDELRRFDSVVIVKKY